MRSCVPVLVLSLASCAPHVRAATAPAPVATPFVEASEAPALLLVGDGTGPVEIWPFDLPAVSSDGSEIAMVEAVPPPAAVVLAGGGPGARLITRRVDTGDVIATSTLLAPEETLREAGARAGVQRRVDVANAELSRRRWVPMMRGDDAGAACDLVERPLRVGSIQVSLSSDRLVVRDAHVVLADRPTRIPAMGRARLARVQVDRARRTLLVTIADCGDAPTIAVHHAVKVLR